MRDVLSVTLAALGAYLAYLAIKLGRAQERISKRQAEITETQFALFEEQRKQKSLARFVISEAPVFDGDDAVYKLIMINEGHRAARDGYWHLTIRAPQQRFVVVNDAETGERIHQHLLQSTAKRPLELIQYSNFFGKPVYPGQTVIEATVQISKQAWAGGHILQVKWRILADDGIGEGDLYFRAMGEIPTTN